MEVEVEMEMELGMGMGDEKGNGSENGSRPVTDTDLVSEYLAI